MEPISGTHVSFGWMEKNISTGDSTPGQDRMSSAGTGDAAAKAKKDEAAIHELQQEDRRVRSHEAAHMAAAGGIARGGATYTYETGPDGVRYAVAGEVNIDTSPERRPQETISKMERVKRAALAPADPSPQDREVAAQASAVEAKARLDLQRQSAVTAQSGPPAGGFKGYQAKPSKGSLVNFRV